MADTIKTVKSSGGDYSSLSAWEAGQQKSIASGDREIAECYAFADALSTTLTIDGWTTAADASIVIRAASGNSHGGVVGAGYRISAPSGYMVIQNLEAYVTCDGIAVSTASTSGVYGVSFSPGGTYNQSRFVFANGLISTSGDYSADSSGRACWAGQGTMIVVNTIVLGKWYYGILETDNGGPHVIAYNCIVAGAINGFYSDVYGKFVNCYSHATTCWTAAGGTQTRTTCMHSSSQSISGSTGNVAYSTANFTSVTGGSEDLSLPSGSALIDAGTDLSGDADYPFSTDFEGVTRSGTWDIGPDEYVASGSAGPAPKCWWDEELELAA